MRKIAVTLVIIFLGVCFMASGPALAKPDKPHLNWGKVINPCQCPKGKVVINISHDVINSADSRVGGGFWALINYKKTIKIIQINDNEFCVSTKFVGDFTTVEGRSPANEADISAGITGTFQGGYKQTYTGTLNPNPDWSTKGYLGTFDHGWDGDPDTPVNKEIDDWENIYFSNWPPPTWDWWGFIYHGGPNGTWVNSGDGNEGDITN